MASHILPGAVTRDYHGPSLPNLLRELADDLEREDMSKVSLIGLTPYHDEDENLYGLIVTLEK